MANSMRGHAGPGARGPRVRAKKGTFMRLVRTLFGFYPVMLPIVIVCILFNAVVSSLPSIFMQNVIAAVEGAVNTGDWQGVSGRILSLVSLLALFYALSLIAGLIYQQLMAIITQGSLAKLRERMFSHMQKLPIKYFDTHDHGSVMSYYTNDIDTLRQMISQSLPSLVSSAVIVTTCFGIMLYYSVWLALVVFAGVAFMMVAVKKIGGGSSEYFLKQQQSLGRAEGFIEEMMNGQKVVKVFCHEDEARRDFERLNDELCENATRANRYANMLMPILHNIGGNITYVAVAVAGGVLLAIGAPNLSISGLAFSVSIAVSFLGMTKQFSGNISQVSNQLNSIIMGLAGADRVFSLIDEEPEVDDGYVTLVNAEIADDGTITESDERTGVWAWKHPHSADGTVTYTRLEGDVRMFDVDFSYDGKKTVLEDVSLYAKPGQKVAFVGSTGAGKTTITNLINRFYDIADGKIRYDGININKIKKSDLRRSLGMVLQDTNLFTGTVMDNIRYGKLDASDDDCIRAAKLAGAHDFITRLPKGYDTELSGNGASLSQGQRQLLSIARAAVADPPVMILDEATSSIDTRTEAIVQRGMDALMVGRTVFVIAHRLSTVHNSDAIMVLEHGRIIERGDHSQLIKEHGTYYRLYTGALELD